MANRAYLYRLSNQPTSYEDRPHTISGVSEWAYDVPFMYRLLMSGNPQLCASLISDGLDGTKTPLYAISSPFESGYERAKRFVAIVKEIIALDSSLSEPPPSPTEPPVKRATPTLAARVKRWFGLASIQPTPALAEAPIKSAAITHLPAWLDETISFLDAHRDQYLLLETIELDLMSEDDPDSLRGLVEREIERSRQVGAAFAALPDNDIEAARIVRSAAAQRFDAPLDAFFGLRFDDNCDSTRTGATEYPIGLQQWSEALYFDLFNREQFAQRETESD